LLFEIIISDYLKLLEHKINFKLKNNSLTVFVSSGLSWYLFRKIEPNASSTSITQMH